MAIKKVSLFFIILVLLLYAAHMMHRSSTSPEAEPVGQISNAAHAKQNEKRIPPVDLTIKVGESRNQREAVRYIEDGILAANPRAFDAALALNGVCAPTQHPKWRSSNPANRLAQEMIRYCSGYVGVSPTTNTGFNDTSVLEAMYAKSVDATTRVELTNLRSESGDSAVRNELDNIIESRDSLKIKAALQYAADENLMPASWQEKISEQEMTTLRMNEIVAVAGDILFCRHSSSCGEGSLYSLQACIATDACGNNISYMQALKMSFSPKAYELANRLATSQ